MATIRADPLERKTQMHREGLMNPGLLSEIVLLGAALIFFALLLIVVAALTQTATLTQRCYAREKR
jgi:hypothetical protein